VILRETGVHILTAVDDIQLLMDDHLLKAQTMRGSPYVKAFETEMQEWEHKLISMQDILEAWLMVRVGVLYFRVVIFGEVSRYLDVFGTHLQLGGHHETDAHRSQELQTGRQSVASHPTLHCQAPQSFGSY
jgi:hypothetical protein